MAIDLLTNPGGLFRRLGKMGATLNALHTFLGGGDLSAASIVSVGVGTDAIEAQFNSARNDLTTGLYAARDSMRASHGSWTSFLDGLAESTLIQQANDQGDLKLPALTVEYALRQLIREMKAASASVSRPTVSASVTVGSANVGNGRLIASILGPDGKQLDYIFAESLRAYCTADAQGSATARQETFTIEGAVSQTDPLAWDWPKGSGASLTLNAVDARTDNDGNNLLQNSSFETFTNANAPDNWPILTGTAGTTILQASGSNAFAGSSGLAFVGNGSELTNVQQPFVTTPSTSLGAGGTSAELEPSTVYALSAWVKVSSTPAAGVLEIALVDGSGTILQDANGANNSVTQSLPAVSTTFVHVSGFFRTPAALPTSYKLRIRLSTALTSTHTVYIDHVALTPATRLYAGGPYVGLFSGSTNFLLDDQFTVAIANNYGSKWALLLERLFGLRDLGLAIPSAASPTIADTLVA